MRCEHLEVTTTVCHTVCVSYMWCNKKSDGHQDKIVNSQETEKKMRLSERNDQNLISANKYSQ